MRPGSAIPVIDILRASRYEAYSTGCGETLGDLNGFQALDRRQARIAVATPVHIGDPGRTDRIRVKTLCPTISGDARHSQGS